MKRRTEDAVRDVNVDNLRPTQADNLRAPVARAELDGLAVTITRSAGADGALVIFIDGPGEQDLNPDGSPACRIHLNDKPLYVGRSYEPACDGCEGCVMPGVHWPTATNCDDSRQWVERCDSCQSYDNDQDAADALIAHLRAAGKTVEHGTAIAHGTSGPTPWVVVA